MNKTNQVLKEKISQRVSGMKSGFFITVDSALTTLDNDINRETLYQFSEKKIKQICKAMNDYCYGRSFQRGEKKLRIISSIEIGKETQRLHAHLIMVHQGDCRRTVEQVDKRLRTVCKRTLRMSGDNAVDVKPFDHKENWSRYFVKSTQFMQSKYDGFMNVEFY